MSTWTQLTDELSACERSITSIRLKSEEKLSAEREKVAAVAKKRQEIVDAYNQQLKELLEVCAVSRDGQSEHAQEEIGEIMNQKAKVDGERRQADEEADASEKRCRELERRVKELHGLLDRSKERHEIHLQQVMDAADDTVRFEMQATGQRVEQLSRHASDMQDGAFDCIGTMEKEVKMRKEEADIRSKERSRFRDLYQVVVRGGQGYQEGFQDTKAQTAKIAQDWHGDWLKSAPSFECSPKRTHEVKRLFLESSGRPRSVDRSKLSATRVAKERARGGDERTPFPKTPRGQPHRPITSREAPMAQTF